MAIDIPNIFQPNTLAEADKVNQNFNAINEALTISQSAAITGYLTNDTAAVLSSPTGVVSSFAYAGGTFKVYDNGVDKTGTNEVNYFITSFNNIGITIDANGVYKVTSLNGDVGNATLLAVYGSVTIEKNYNIVKVKTGADAASYSLDVSVAAINRSQEGVLNPPTITARGSITQGATAPSEYAGRFKIYQNSTLVYTSANNESTKIFTPDPSSTDIKIEFYFAEGTSVKLGEKIIPIINDGISGNNGTGVDGINTVSIFLYARSTTATAPALNRDGYSVYNFTSKTLEGAPAGWTRIIPDSVNGGYLYAIQATAASRNETDQILNSEWSEPALYTSNAINNHVVTLYQRSAVTLGRTNLPTEDVVYSFSEGRITSPITFSTGWKKEIPSGTDPIYVTLATAVSTTITATIHPNQWTDPVIQVKNGDRGESQYMHVLWAAGTLENGPITDLESSTPPKSNPDSSYHWMGSYVDNVSSDAGPTSQLWKWKWMKGETGNPGGTKYIHIAYATDVVKNASGTVTSVTGFTFSPTLDSAWMGICSIDSSTPPSATSWNVYTWSKTQGPPATSAVTDQEILNVLATKGLTTTTGSNFVFTGTLASNVAFMGSINANQIAARSDLFNLIKTSSFEDIPSGKIVPEKGTWSSAYAIQETTGLHRKYCLASNISDLFEDQSFLVTPGEELSLSCWVNTASSANTATFGISYLTSTGSGLENNSMAYEKINATTFKTEFPANTGWKQYKGTLIVPSNAAAGKAWIHKNGGSASDIVKFVDMKISRQGIISCDQIDATKGTFSSAQIGEATIQTLNIGGSQVTAQVGNYVLFRDDLTTPECISGTNWKTLNSITVKTLDGTANPIPYTLDCYSELSVKTDSVHLSSFGEMSNVTGYQVGETYILANMSYAHPRQIIDPLNGFGANLSLYRTIYGYSFFPVDQYPTTQASNGGVKVWEAGETATFSKDELVIKKYKNAKTSSAQITTNTIWGIITAVLQSLNPGVFGLTQTSSSSPDYYGTTVYKALTNNTNKDPELAENASYWMIVQQPLWPNCERIWKIKDAYTPPSTYVAGDYTSSTNSSIYTLRHRFAKASAENTLTFTKNYFGALGCKR